MMAVYMTPISLPPTAKCRHCGYSLTGLTRLRCPESGNGFSVRRLKRMIDETARPFNSWDRYRNPAAFFSTFYQVLRSPRKFARRIPNRYPSGAAISFSVWCYALASAIHILSRIPGFAYQITSELYFVALVCLIAWAFETATAFALSRWLRPTGSSHPYHIWRAITHYTSVYLVLNMACGAVGAITDLGGADLTMRIFLPVVLGLINFGVYVWWLGSLFTMVWARSGGARRILAIPFIILVGLFVFAASVLFLFFV